MEELNEIIIGMDQSYKNTGISVAKNKKLAKVTSLNLEKCKNKSEARIRLYFALKSILNSLTNKYRPDEIKLILERIRLYSRGFVNIDYIKSIGALNSVIIDACYEYNIQVFSVDTRAWKSQVIGTTKGKANKYGVPEEKWPTVEWVIKQGFENSILEEVKGRKEKGTFIIDGIRYQYNNDAADSAGIAMFGVVGKKENLKLES